MSVAHQRPPKAQTPAADRRRRRGAETRRRIEQAAAHLFTRDGYTPTTMPAIANDAGVHVQTIYLAYGTKSALLAACAALLAACAARLVAGDEDPETHPGERRWACEVAGEPDPRAKLARYVKQFGDVSPRITSLIDVLRATAPAEPEVAEFLTQMENGRRESPRQLLGLGVPPARGERDWTQRKSQTSSSRSPPRTRSEHWSSRAAGPEPRPRH